MAWVVELKDIRVCYGTSCVLNVGELKIAPTERVFVLGRSGAGKTTLSQLIKGRLKPSEGSISVLGHSRVVSAKEERENQRHIAMIDQEFFLIPRLSVVNNVLLGCLGRVSPGKSLLGWYPASEWEKAEAILVEVGLKGLENRRVETLSGGQRQRVAIARALMQDADIIIADEPISNLDPELAEEALRLLVDCTKRRNETLLVNLHQPSLARKFASRFIGLSRGRVVYDGPPVSFTSDDEEFVYRGNENGKGSSKK